MSLVSCVGGVDSCIGRFLVLVSVSCRTRCLAFVLVGIGCFFVVVVLVVPPLFSRASQVFP